MEVTFARILSTSSVTLLACAAIASDGGEHGFTLSSGVRSAAEHARSLSVLTGYAAPAFGSCEDVQVGPLPDAQYTAPEAWLKLLEDRCPLRWSPTDKRWESVANLCTESGGAAENRRARRRVGQKIEELPRACGLLGMFHLEQKLKQQECTNTNCKQKFFLNIPAGPIEESLEQFSVQTGCQITSNHGDLDDWTAPSIVGLFRTKDALRKLTTGTNLVQKWVGCSTVHLYPRNLPYGEGGVTDMLVTGTRLGSLQGSAPKVMVLDREQIDRTGASGIPELLQHLPQTAFSRGSGFRPSGAQYAELRGIGARYTKVLINGRPTFGTAADLIDGAFDLNTIPLGAVERVEVSLDGVSLSAGADAVGGTINLVLRDGDEDFAEARYESARGGAATYRGSVVSGVESGGSSASIALEYSRTAQLLGAERDRWRNQDWTRYGGIDHRSLAASPPNVESLDGMPLPGQDGYQNLTSLLAWQSIVPESNRFTASVIGHHEIGQALLTSELLVSDRNVLSTFAPEVISGAPMAADHPQNPFGIPVAVSAALTGLPSPHQEFESTLLRGVLAARGSFRGFNFDTHLLHTTDRSEVTSRNNIDLNKVIDGLSGSASTPFNVISDRPGAGAAHVLTPARTQRFVNGATQLAALGHGPIWQLPSGAIVARTGIEVRREFAEFLGLGRFDRDVVSALGSIHMPIVRGVSAEIGIRRDDYEGSAPVTNAQYVARWHPSDAVRFHASYSDAYDPPDFWDLRFPSTVLNGVPLFDPKRGEIASVTIRSGGNEQLRPTTGHVSSLGIKWGTRESHLVSMSLWRVDLKDRISLVRPLTLLANEDTAIPGRIGREAPSFDDVANHRPGRLSTLDITRANFARTAIQGVDLSLATTVQTSDSAFRPQLDVSYSDKFRVSELPVTDSPEREVTGIARDSGTITKWRFRGSLSYMHARWTANFLARYNSCYRDFISAEGRLADRSPVCPGVGIDMNASMELSQHIIIKLGISDLYTDSAPYSDIVDLGFDPSQRDLAGLTGYFGVEVRL